MQHQGTASISPAGFQSQVIQRWPVGDSHRYLGSREGISPCLGETASCKEAEVKCKDRVQWPLFLENKALGLQFQDKSGGCFSGQAPGQANEPVSQNRWVSPPKCSGRGLPRTVSVPRTQEHKTTATRGRQSGVLLHSSLEPGHQVHVKLCADMRSGSTGWGEEASVRRPQEAGALAAVAESLEVAPPCPGRHPSCPPPHVIKSDTCRSGQS